MRKVAIASLIAAWLLGSAWVCRADSAAPVAMPKLGIVGSSLQAGSSAQETGIAASEVLRGNGSRAGYVLGHGNVVPQSEWVFVGVSRAKRGVDYSIDYTSGNLYFNEPVKSRDSVRVDYRYSEKGQGERNVVSSGTGMALRFGSNMQANLTYSYRAADTKIGMSSPDILTYGINTTTKLGFASSLSSMMYVATPQATGRMAIATTATATPNDKKSAQAVKKDHLMVQNADLGMGKVRLKIGMQDVGQDFAGFNAMRDSKAAPEDVLKQLEKEKGLKRLGFTGSMPMVGGGLQFSREQIDDKNAGILSQSFGYTGSNFKMGFMTREVDKGFTRFKDIRETDRDQLAAEAGIKRTGYFMQFRTGATAPDKPIWSGLSFATLDSPTGTLTYRSADLDVGKLNVQADVLSMDPGFTAMKALTEDERQRLALIARRQFDPRAQAAAVDAKDKAQINNEAGLGREAFRVSYDTGPAWLSLATSNVSSAKGGLSRSDVNIQHKFFSLYLSHQSIDQGFDRLSSMLAIEQKYFGNEYGMTRTRTGGTFKLGFADVDMSIGNVVDHQGASVKRSSIDVANKWLKFHVNFQDIDPRFSRIMDLSDADKKMLVDERGFKRSDYTLDLQATKRIHLKSYVYNSTNITADQDRAQSKHELEYTLPNGLKLTALSDDYSYISDDGVLASHSRRKITFDNSFTLFGGLLFKGLSDINDSQEEDGTPVTTSVNQMHVESNQKAPTSYTFDMLQNDYDLGRYENTWATGAKAQLMKRLALRGTFANTARDHNMSETSGAFGFDWDLRKNLKMSFSVNNRDGGPKGSQQAHQFSLNGLLAKRLLLLDNVTVGSANNSTELKGKQIGCDNAMKIDAGLLGGKVSFDNSDKLNPKNGIYYTSRLMRYESNKDPKKWYHLSFFRQNLKVPTGQPAQRRNYSADFRISRALNLTMTQFKGKDGKEGAVLPVGGGVLKFSYAYDKVTTLTTDYTTDTNTATGRSARTTGLGMSTVLPNKSVVEAYVGWSHLTEAGKSDQDIVYRLKFDHKIDASHFITLTAQKKSLVDKSSINPYEGDTTARLDYSTLFN